MGSILCIDDEPHVANLRCMALEAAGHAATPCWTIADAKFLLTRREFEVLVVGAQAGAEWPAICRKLKRARRPPIVIVTSYRSDDEPPEEQCADIYFEKTIDPEHLVSVIDEMLRVRDSSVVFNGSMP